MTATGRGRPNPRPRGQVRDDAPSHRRGNRSDDDLGPGHRGERLTQGPSPATAAALLRVLVRAAIIAVFVGIAWVAFSALSDVGGDADTLDEQAGSVEVDPTAPPLDQVLLRLSDLPRGWSVQAADPTSDDVCDGRTPRSVIEPTGLARAAFTRDDRGGLIGNVLMEFANEDTARAFMDLTATVVESCREYGADGSTVQLSPMSFPRLGDETFVAEASGESPGGAIHGAIVYLRDGNRVASVITITFGDTEVNAALVEHLTGLLDRRLRDSVASEAPGSTEPAGEPSLPGE